MGAFTNDNEPVVNVQDEEEVDGVETTNIETGIDGVFAQNVVKHGSVDLPVFEVDSDEFFSNMSDNRKRLRFKSGTHAQKYMAGTNSRSPFFISTTIDGKKYQRKIK